MAVVSTVAAVDLNNFHGIKAPGIVAGGREIEEEPMSRAIEERIYVALGKEVEKNKSVLLWALQNSGGKRVCIIHVHRPAQMIPLLGGKFSVSSLNEEQVQAYREIERQDMHKILDRYLHVCLRTGVRAEKLFIEMDSIERGILELISRHGIKKLVMGGAADKHYPKYKPHKKMMDLKSKKANSVREQAPKFCHIWFICKGYLIHTREGTLVGSDIMVSSSSVSPSPSTQSEGFNCSVALPLTDPKPSDLTHDLLRRVRSADYEGLEGRASAPCSSSVSPSPSTQSEGLNRSRSQSIALPLTDLVKPSDLAHDLLRRVRSADYEGLEGRASAPFSSDGTEGSSTPRSRPDAEVSLDEWVGSRRCPSQVSSFLFFSPSRMADSALVPLMQGEGSGNGLESCALPHVKEHLQQSSPPSVLDGSMDETMYDQLEQVMADAANSRREAFEEALRRAKAEKDAIEAIRRVKASELLYSEEQKQRKEIEETLKKEKEELVKVKNQHDLIMEELHIASHQQLLLKNQVAESEQMVTELEEKIISAVELLQTYKKERDELEIERDNALKEAEELRRSKAEASSIHVRQFFTEFSFSEIKEATQSFDASLKIGEGGYGSIYKGLLRHTEVAIKMLHSNSLQGPSEFRQEVDVLCKMRHPNLVTLIGACPEAWTLIYEYLPNGSLEDRLSCRDNSPPLSWQARIRIAAELCSVLIFLHSSKPYSIVHGDLKPSNILLDKNFVSKLSDFGICRLLAHDESLSSNSTICCRTDPKGTFAYIDPEFLSTGELSPKSDVYSFGIILLRLLTGRPALGITKEVQYAVDTSKLKTLLDPLAGDWPFVQAEQLAHLALRCCEMNRKSRPSLETEIWRVLEPMRASCGGSLSFRLGSEEHHRPPSYFICPIFQEIMQDPQIAADGFTYEAEALRGWLDSGHDTSPMTNLKLAHCNLVPNHALRSAIQEWLQQH